MLSRVTASFRNFCSTLDVLDDEPLFARDDEPFVFFDPHRTTKGVESAKQPSAMERGLF
jgi:hypothetical protein